MVIFISVYQMDGLGVPSLSEAIEEMVVAYQDVNSVIDSYSEDPGIEIYARHIDKNRPFIIRGGCSKWASHAWNIEYLISNMEGRSVKVAETPLGNADAVVIRPEDGMEYFVKPCERTENFSQFMSFLQPFTADSFKRGQSIKYSQART